MEPLLDRLLEFFKTEKQFGMFDQSDLPGGFTWDEGNAIAGELMKGKLVSDEPDEDGFEEVVWNYPYKGKTFRLTTVYGIGSFSIIELT